MTAPLLRAFVLMFLLSSGAPQWVRAESPLNPRAQISSNDQARMRLHGIRNTMLDPQYWGSLAREKTHNVRITPIKRFFLRSSEDQTFRVKRIRLRFHFLRTTKQRLLDASTHSDPVLEIGFAGRIDDTTEEGYAVRFSAYPQLSSGVFYHLDGRYTQVEQASREQLGAYQDIEAELSFSQATLAVTVDGKHFASFSGKDLDKGYIWLISSWHPVYITELEIRGERGESTQREATAESGLWKLPTGAP